MAEPFDPYHIWLGIPPAEQPADHYRLLGISRFESNLDVISNAADQRVRHVRSMQTGKRQAESQRLLNEIAAASGVLSDLDSKDAYDARLREKLAARSTAVPAATLPVAQPLPPEPGTRIPANPNVPAAPRNSFSATRANTFLHFKWIVAAGAGASILALIFVVALIFVARGRLQGSTVAIPQNPQQHVFQPSVSGGNSLSRAVPSGSVSVPSGNSVVPAPTVAAPTIPLKTPARPLPTWLADYGTYDDQRYSPIAEGRLGSVLTNVDGLKNRITLDDFSASYALCGGGNLDFCLPDWYLFEVRLTRLEGKGPLTISFPFGRRHEKLVLDKHPEIGFLSGLEVVREVSLPQRDDDTRYAGRLVEPNSPVKMKIYVGNGCMSGVLQKEGESLLVFNWLDPGLVRREGESNGCDFISPIHIQSQMSRWLLEDCFVTPLYLKHSPALTYNHTGTPGPPPWLFGLRERSQPSLGLASFPVKSLSGETKILPGQSSSTSPQGMQSSQFQIRVPENYSLQIDLSRGRGTGPLAVDFPVAGNQCRIVLDRVLEKTYWSGIELVAGLPLESRKDPSVAQGKKLAPAVNGSLRIRVDGGRVSAKLSAANEATYFNWSGDPTQLGRTQNFPLVPEGQVGLSSLDAEIIFSMWLTPLDQGKVAVLKSDTTIAATELGGNSPKKTASQAKPTSPVSPSPPLTTTSSLLPVPTAEELAKAGEKLREAFGDLEKQKKPEERRFLASEFITGSKDERDPAVCYAMLDAARILAVEAQDLQMAMEADQKICRKFQIDSMQQYLSTLKLASGKSMPAIKWEEFGRSAVILAKSALIQRESGIADEGSQIAVEFSAKGKNMDLKKEAKQLRDLVVAFKQNEESFKQACQKLAEDPNDAEANLMLGRWYCLIMDDFAKGLPHLSKGSEPLLAAAAQAERRPETKALAVADAWFEAAGKLVGYERVAALKHSREFYTRAKENSGGLEQLRAGKREAEIRDAIEAAEKGKSGRSPTNGAK